MNAVVGSRRRQHTAVTTTAAVRANAPPFLMVKAAQRWGEGMLMVEVKAKAKKRGPNKEEDLKWREKSG